MYFPHIVRDEVTFNMTTGMKTGAPAPRQVALAHMYYKDTEEGKSAGQG